MVCCIAQIRERKAGEECEWEWWTNEITGMPMLHYGLTG